MQAKKSVLIHGHEFDCLPGHLTCSGIGHGATLRVAAQRAMADLLANRVLRHKHVGSFKATIVIHKHQDAAAIRAANTREVQS